MSCIEHSENCLSVYYGFKLTKPLKSLRFICLSWTTLWCEQIVMFDVSRSIEVSVNCNEKIALHVIILTQMKSNRNAESFLCLFSECSHLVIVISAAHEEKQGGAVEWFFSGFHPIFLSNQGEQKLHAVYFKIVLPQVHLSKVNFSKGYFSNVYLYFLVVFIQIFCPIRVGRKKCYGMECATAHNHSPGCEPEKSPNFLLIIDRYHPPHLSDHWHSPSPKTFLFLRYF